MIKAKHNLIGKVFWRNYFHWMMKKHFHKVILINENNDIDISKGMLIFSNHFSWWDGFIYHYLNHKYWHKTFYIMMLADKLKENPFLRYEGAFGIQKNSRDVMEAFKYTEELLNEKNNIVCIYPQGRIESQHITEDINIEKGMLKLAISTNYTFS